MPCLQALKVLELGDNCLQQVPEGLPQSLEALHLEGNHLQGVPQRLGSLCSNLRTLTLDNNCITSLPGRLLQDLGRLKWLGLHGNPVMREGATTPATELFRGAPVAATTISST